MSASATGSSGRGRQRWVVAGALASLILGGFALTSLDCPTPSSRRAGRVLDLSSFSAEPPSRSLRLLFLHHSCGGQWLAPTGPDVGEHSIYRSAVNGGGLREALAAAGYEVHEASYGSRIGERTDVFDWPPKFRDQMDAILSCNHQDRTYPDDRRNQIVLFKSCFPNNLFTGPGEGPGDPRGPGLTVGNAQAAYTALLPEFARRPQTLFVAATAPPLACPPQPRWKVLARRLLGRADLRRSGHLARTFNAWLADPEEGWLGGYEGHNVVVFDYYDLLTDGGASNFSRYATGSRGEDSHPSAEGNRRATERLVPFLNAAVRRAGLDGSDSTSGTPAPGT